MEPGPRGPGDALGDAGRSRSSSPQWSRGLAAPVTRTRDTPDAECQASMEPGPRGPGDLPSPAAWLLDVAGLNGAGASRPR